MKHCKIWTHVEPLFINLCYMQTVWYLSQIFNNYYAALRQEYIWLRYTLANISDQIRLQYGSRGF